MIYLGFIIAASYLLLIFSLYRGWRHVKTFPKDSDTQAEKVRVSIVVPARNEEKNVKALLKDINEQKYPQPWIEIILVDDASGDKTAEAISEWHKGKLIELKLIQLQEQETNYSPKKRAMSEGINYASGDLIITTDADCRVGKNWLATIVSHYLKTNAKMLSGPVRLSPLKSFFSKIQALEFSSLVGSGAGAIGLGKPLMCNGANLAFEKEAFDEVGGYAGNEIYASGDDVFLMMKMKATYGSEAISFVKDAEAIVDTPPKAGWKEFINQRTRWASKAKAYKSLFALFSSGVVFLFAVALLLVTLGFLMGNVRLESFLALWVVKLVIDYIFLYRINRFLNQSYLMRYYFPAQSFTIGYTIIAGFLGNFGSFIWKGRRYR